eukprot:15204244-Alexandrium_andersonii.AAC.1
MRCQSLHAEWTPVLRTATRHAVGLWRRFFPRMAAAIGAATRVVTEQPKTWRRLLFNAPKKLREARWRD